MSEGHLTVIRDKIGDDGNSRGCRQFEGVVAMTAAW